MRSNKSFKADARTARRLTPALGGRAASLCSCLVRCLFGFVFAARNVLFRAGLRCCFSRAWQCVASCARWCLSSFRSSSHARFIATWRLSSAVRSSLAGHNRRGIAGLSKQRYRVANRRHNVCRLTSHSSGRLCRRLIPALGGGDSLVLPDLQSSSGVKVGATRSVAPYPCQCRSGLWGHTTVPSCLVAHNVSLVRPQPERRAHRFSPSLRSHRRRVGVYGHCAHRLHNRL